MSRLTRRVAVKARPAGGGAKTYAEFQAHIATLATNGAKSWTSAVNTNGSFMTTVGAASGGLAGSPWSAQFRRGTDAGATSAASLTRVVQHGFPSEAVFNSQSGQDIFVRIDYSSTGPVTGLTRNGYASYSSATGADRMICSMLLYYVAGEGAFAMNPYGGSGPTPYTW